jgi:hypothetical protein
MAQRLLGAEHPVSKTAACLAVEGDTTELTSKFSRLCIDTANNTLADTDYGAAVDIQCNALYFLEQSGNLDDAEKACQQMVRKAHEKYARTHVSARQALRDLSWI